MDIYIGRRGSWDAMSYPEVYTWPLSVEREKSLTDSYCRMLIAYRTYENWKEAWRWNRLDDYFFSAEIEVEKLPEKIYVVLGFHPEHIDDVWNRRSYTRLRVDMAWNGKCRPAFASLDEAGQFVKNLAQNEPNSRFAIAELKL